MRIFLSFLIGIITAVVVVALAGLVALNGQNAALTTTPGQSVQVTMGWLLAAAVALGVALAFLILIPGRLASAWQRWLLGQRAQALEQRLQTLREQHAELQGSHQRLVEEHHRMLEHVLAPATTARRAAQDEAGGAAQETAGVRAVQMALPRTGPLFPNGHGPRGAELERQAPKREQRRQREQATLLAQLRDQVAALRARVAAMAAQLRRRMKPSDDRTKGRNEGSRDGDQPPHGTAASA